MRAVASRWDLRNMMVSCDWLDVVESVAIPIGCDHHILPHRSLQASPAFGGLASVYSGLHPVHSPFTGAGGRPAARRLEGRGQESGADLRRQTTASRPPDSATVVGDN